MKKTVNIIFIVSFLIIISVPFIFFCLRIKTDVKKGEKKMSLNFKRDYPLKSELIKTYTLFEENVLKIDPIPNKVVTVDNGWRFLGDSFSNPLSESIGKINFTTEELIKLENRLLYRKKWFKDRNIKMYIAVAPNKHTYYRELLPFGQSLKKTKMQQLDSLCKSNNINYINLGDDFPEKGDQLLYYKTDTHWNQFAGLYAYNTTAKKLKLDLKNLNCQTYTLTDFDVTLSDTIQIGDLNDMLKKPHEEKYIVLTPKTAPKAIKKTSIYPIPDNYINAPKLYEARFTSERNEYKLLVFHDSYMGYYQKHLKENFGKTTFIWDHSFNEKVIESEQPDIFYHEILERQVDLLLEY